MGFDSRDGRRSSGNGGQRQNRGFSGSRSGSGSGNSGRIENFEKPLIELLKEINEKLDLLIKK